MNMNNSYTCNDAIIVLSDSAFSTITIVAEETLTIVDSFHDSLISNNESVTVIGEINALLN